jgi:predicted HTH domain antitoxin
MAVLVSDEELQAARLTEAEARLAMAVRLYEDDRVTIGQAALLAHLDRLQFYHELAKRKVSRYDLEMLQEDLDYARNAELR